MNITDQITKVVKSFKPVEVKTEIKNPAVNYQSPTNIFYIESVKLNELCDNCLKISTDSLKETEKTRS